MKYKRLQEEELHKLQKEFVDFLVINGITADDWIKLKAEAPQRASGIIDSFSDVIYHGAMQSIQYVQVTTPQEIMVFYCQPNQIVLVGISTDDKTIDMTALHSYEIFTKHPTKFHVYTQTKPYRGERNVEVFEMIEKGAVPTDGKLFQALLLAL